MKNVGRQANGQMNVSASSVNTEANVATLMMMRIKMSTDKLEHILATYPPVEGKPGYVWVSRQNLRIIKIDTLREAIKEYLEGDVGDGQFNRDSSSAQKNS